MTTRYIDRIVANSINLNGTELSPTTRSDGHITVDPDVDMPSTFVVRLDGVQYEGVPIPVATINLDNLYALLTTISTSAATMGSVGYLTSVIAFRTSWTGTGYNRSPSVTTIHRDNVGADMVVLSSVNGNQLELSIDTTATPGSTIYATIKVDLVPSRM